MESIRGKYRLIRWLWLLLVFITIIALPSEIKDINAMVSENHRTLWLIPVLVMVGLVWNGMLLKLWWDSRP
jgi:hypothetical protein